MNKAPGGLMHCGIPSPVTPLNGECEQEKNLQKKGGLCPGCEKERKGPPAAHPTRPRRGIFGGHNRHPKLKPLYREQAKDNCINFQILFVPVIWVSTTTNQLSLKICTEIRKEGTKKLDISQIFERKKNSILS